MHCKIWVLSKINSWTDLVLCVSFPSEGSDSHPSPRSPPDPAGCRDGTITPRLIRWFYSLWPSIACVSNKCGIILPISPKCIFGHLSISMGPFTFPEPLFVTNRFLNWLGRARWTWVWHCQNFAHTWRSCCSPRLRLDVVFCLCFEVQNQLLRQDVLQGWWGTTTYFVRNSPFELEKCRKFCSTKHPLLMGQTFNRSQSEISR